MIGEILYPSSANAEKKENNLQNNYFVKIKILLKDLEKR